MSNQRPSYEEITNLLRGNQQVGGPEAPRFSFRPSFSERVRQQLGTEHQLEDFNARLIKTLNDIGDLLGVPVLGDPDPPQPTVTLRLSWLDPKTKEQLFALSDLTSEPGSTITVEAVPDLWRTASLQIEVVSIDQPGPQEIEITASTDFMATGSPERWPRNHQEGPIEFPHLRMGLGFTFDGPTTTCAITYRGKYSKGEARCHPDDHYDQSEGRKLAFRRALEQQEVGPFHRQAAWQAYFLQWPLDKIAKRDR